MAPLTELQQQEMLDTLFPDQKDEPELVPIPREVVSSEELDKLFPEEPVEEPLEEPLEEPTSDKFAWAEGLGPQLDRKSVV